MPATTANHPRALNPFIRSATRKNMSVTQTYYLAHTARAKLSREAAQPDHDLRLLVGHANLLDSLMLELADAEREQERWFNQSVRGASKTPQRRVQWADRVEEHPEEDAYETSESEDSDLSEDDEYDEQDFEMANAVSMRIPAPQVDDDDLSEDDLEEDYAHLELVRTPSHSSSPPELMDPDSDTSDDESMPPSPADATLPFTDEKNAKGDHSEDALEEEYYVSRRTSTGLVSAISVY